MSQLQVINIDYLTCTSLFLEVFDEDRSISTATGFVITLKNNFYLVTNWHVVTGKHADTGEQLSSRAVKPTHLNIIHHHNERLGKTICVREALFDDKGNAKWLEHSQKNKCDVVLFLLTNAKEVKFYPFDLNLKNVDMIPEVAMPVSIIGFPLGISSVGQFPVWKTGHIASEPLLDFCGLPLFLIDATTRGGMSGSPVVLRLHGGYKTSDGKMVMATAGPHTKFLGIYSGRMNSDVELGRVWKPSVIEDIAKVHGLL